MSVDLATLSSQHLAIVGRVGSGKTYTAKGMVESLLAEKRRVCILDPTGVWWGLRSSVDGKRPGFPVFVFGGPRADVPITEHSGATLAKIIATKNLPAIIDLSELLIGQRHRFVTDFAEALYRDNRAPLHLVVDEADEFAPQNPMPETKRMLHHVDRIVRRGRVRGFRVMLITQRPAVLHKNVLTQANALIAMRLTAPQDRKAIQAWVDGQADAGKAKAVLESLARLQQGEGWIWAPELDVLQRQKFSPITTFDSSRTPDDDDDLTEPTRLADVDLTEIRKDFETVEAEARTVAELRAEVTKLRGALTRAEKVATSELAPNRKPAGMHDEAEVQRRVREALATAPEPVLPARVLRAVATAIAALQAVEASSGEHQVAPAPRQRDTSTAPAPRAREAAPAPGPVAVGVTAPQQRILDALARLEAFGVAAPQKPVLAAMTGVSSKSSGYTNNLGAMRSAGLVEYPAGGCVALTAAGRAASNAPDRPPTLDDVHAGWFAMVPRPQADLLRALVAAYPQALPKAELAARVGVSATSSGYTNNLGALRSLGAVCYPQPGHVAATELLFPKAAT